APESPSLPWPSPLRGPQSQSPHRPVRALPLLLHRGVTGSSSATLSPNGCAVNLFDRTVDGCPMTCVSGAPEEPANRVHDSTEPGQHGDRLGFLSADRPDEGEG